MRTSFAAEARKFSLPTQSVNAYPGRSLAIQAAQREESAALLLGRRRDGVVLHALPQRPQLRAKGHTRQAESLGGLGQIAACLIHHVADDDAIELLERTPIEIALAATRVT